MNIIDLLNRDVQLNPPTLVRTGDGRDSLPRSPVGKAPKREVRARYRAGAERQVS